MRGPCVRSCSIFARVDFLDSQCPSLHLWAIVTCLIAGLKLVEQHQHGASAAADQLTIGRGREKAFQMHTHEVIKALVLDRQQCLL